MKRTAGRQWNRISIGIFGSTCHGFPGFSSVSLTHSGRSLFPCTSETTKLTLTVKTDYVMSGTRDVDLHGP